DFGLDGRESLLDADAAPTQLPLP
ncbi:MAG: hypothetical protein QOK06_2804, partial [Acidimicrobiaceae bacterium]